jgi:hypothetical protein
LNSRLRVESLPAQKPIGSNGYSTLLRCATNARDHFGSIFTSPFPYSYKVIPFTLLFPLPRFLSAMGRMSGVTFLHNACPCSIKFGYVRLNIEVSWIYIARELEAQSGRGRAMSVVTASIWRDHCLFIVEHPNPNTAIFHYLVPFHPTQ